MKSRYDELARERAARIAADGTAPEAEERLAELARQARDAAERETNPVRAVALWRFAALSAWQGGASGLAELGSIVTAGQDACDALDPPDLAAPGDCLAIRAAPIRAAADEAQTAVSALEAMPRPLSAADGDRIVSLFNGLESSSRRAAELRDRFAASSIDEAQLTELDRDRAQLYCVARQDLNLLPRVDGNTLASITPFAARRDAMRSALPPSLRADPCP